MRPPPPLQLQDQGWLDPKHQWGRVAEGYLAFRKALEVIHTHVFLPQFFFSGPLCLAFFRQ